MALDRRFDPNPDYGSGIYRRRIRLKKTADMVLAELLDDYHEIVCFMYHDGHVVTRLNTHIIRVPFSTCPGAAAATDELIGLPLAIGRRSLYGDGRPQRNCTHAFDLVSFALSHATSQRRITTIEFVLPDLVEGGQDLQVLVDGQVAIQWYVGPDEIIRSPVEYAGQAFFNGYAKWAAARFSGFELELALHLQKIILVSRGRRWKIEDEKRNSIREEPERIGACFTFSEPQFSNAQANRGYIRDFTNRPTDF